MSGITLSRPWLEFDLGQPLQVLSWAINRPGFAMAHRILWREVRNADLARDMDVQRWLQDQLSERGATDAICLLTSRDVTTFEQAQAGAGQAAAQCVATVGLSNAERVGARVDRRNADWGTINVAVRLTTPLSRTGLIEALSIVAQARTCAILEVGLMLPGGAATGTGTDCIAIAAPEGAQDYAGLHTDLGEALGAAVHAATLAGARRWMRDTRATLPDALFGG